MTRNSMIQLLQMCVPNNHDDCCNKIVHMCILHNHVWLLN
jgi:hypothetical protein